MFPSFRKSKEKIAIEINNHLMKMVCFHDKRIKWWQHWPLGTASDKQISDHIRLLFKTKKVSSPTGILSLSRDILTVGMLHFPSVDPAEIASMVEVNAVRQVPYPKSEIVLGWRVIGIDENGFSDVFLAICQRLLISRYIAILETAGLNIEDVRMNSEGTVNWLLSQDNSIAESSKVDFILDIDGRYSDLIAIKGGNLMMSRLIAHGVDFFRGASSENLRVFVSEFKQTFEMIPENLLEKKSNNLFLVGAKYRLIELEQHLKREFNFNIIRIVPQEDMIKNFSFCGLLGIAHDALSERTIFDIPDMKIKKQWKKKMRQLVAMSILFAYTVAVALITLGTKIYKRQEVFRQLQLEYNQISQGAGELSVIVDKVKLIQNIKRPEGSLLYYLHIVSDVLPQGCQIISFDYQKDKQILIKGQTPAVSTVFDFVSSLEKIDSFSSVQTRYTRKVTSKDFQGSEFEIIAVLK